MLGFKCRYVLLIYDGQLHSVGSPISGLKHDQLAVRFHRFASKAVGAGFDADCILSLTHHAPFDVARHGAGIIGDADAGASKQPRIVDGDLHFAAGIGHHAVFEGLLRPIRLGGSETRPTRRIIDVGIAE